ncbi:uncharacterized protein LOC119660762 isoform X2 [Hermetia illucens]|uniref:uncharacterized protein LOC119660762 isoform X2 n=1 Tax=Hermetia illucens TaxID=343691 RepID=UPI0018CC790C|nr:uncharacterized protein LOC119660762 isoform X2 [Hermetia illucens]
MQHCCRNFYCAYSPEAVDSPSYILESSSENQPQQSLPSSLSASSPLFASLSQQHNRNLQWPKMNFGASDVSDSSASHADRSMHTAANDPNARLKFFLKHPQRFMNNLDQLM